VNSMRSGRRGATWRCGSCVAVIDAGAGGEGCRQ